MQKSISRKLKKGDQVLVIAGKDTGKRGAIEKIFPKTDKITVTGVNIAKHHLKPSRNNPHGGIISKISPINISNVAIICPRCSQPSRVGYKLISNKDAAKSDKKKISKLRICKKCKESLD